MNKKLNEIIEDNYENNIVPIRTQKDLGETSEDWLSKLDEGTTFLCYFKALVHREYLLDEFTIVVKSEIGAIALKDFHNQIWVIPSLFCRKYSLFGVL